MQPGAMGTSRYHEHMKNPWKESPRALLRAEGEHFDLSAVDPASTPGWRKGCDADDYLADTAGELADLQEMLFANGRTETGAKRSLLLVLQAMDTAGKGGIVKHVIGNVDPQGTHIHGFKKPTPVELKHDFLWRIRRELPAIGLIGVFDRSHYEDVLVHRVRHLSPAEVVEQRYGIINDFEAELTEQGTTVVKVMLHISKDEQRRRLESRLDRPDKHWKYSPNDVDERELWPAYQEAYQIAIQRTSTAVAPWHVVPADSKQYSRAAVQRILIETLEDLALTWPKADFDVETERRRLAAS